jgi:MFS family permease
MADKNPLLESGDVEVTNDDVPSWNKSMNDLDEERLLERVSRGSVGSLGGSRLSGARLSTTEFENAPHKAPREIDWLEAKKWLDPYSPVNRGIFASYFAVGFGLFFIQTPVAFYMVDTLGASPGQQSVVTGLMSLPWAMKIGCGFLSDSTPIFGLRRKPYFIIGWTVFAVCNAILAIIGEPSIGTLAVLIFTQTLGFVQADVCTDAMIVERSKMYESTETQGTLQATGYIIRFGGGVIGALAGSCLYNQDDWGWGLPMWLIFAINGCLPGIMIAPFIGPLVEIGLEKPPALKAQVQSIWELVQQKAVWMPCTFIYMSVFVFVLLFFLLFLL